MKRSHYILPHRRFRIPFLSGCLVVFALIGICVVGTWLFKQWAPSLQAILAKKSDEAKTTQSARTESAKPDYMKEIRGQVEHIQKEWEKLSTSGEMKDRLQKLHDEIAKHRDQTTVMAKKYWEEISEKSKSLIELSKSQGSQIPGELEKMKGKIQKLEEMEKIWSKDRSRPEGKQLETIPSVEQPEVKPALPPQPELPAPDETSATSETAV